MTNREWYERACRSLVGGVNSPVRAWGAVGGTPRFFLRGRGAVLEDAEGREVLDYVCSWGPLILGHACPEVVRAVGEAAGRSTSFGAPCPGEVELAEAVKRRFPSIEKIRFVSSGTEATMTALRLMRGVTGREWIVKFAGNYHGHSDSLLVAAGSGALTFGVPTSPGIPASVAEKTLVLPYNDPEAAEDLFETLRALRRRIAEEQGVPPYVVFPDSTLRALCRLRPSTPEEFLEVPGVGESKLRRYGDRFLQLLSESP